jgi:hypothetical protein
MSIGWIRHADVDILYLNLEGIVDHADKLEHVRRVNELVSLAEGGALVLVNLTNFMPGPGFMDFANESLKDRARKIRKAAYVGVERKNRMLFDSYDAYNANVVNRRAFKELDQALAWLVEDAAASMPSANA